MVNVYKIDTSEADWVAAESLESAISLLCEEYQIEARECELIGTVDLDEPWDDETPRMIIETMLDAGDTLPFIIASTSWVGME